MSQIDKSYSNKTAVVTGGAGFIGAHLVRRLVAAESKVIVLDNLQSGAWKVFDGISEKVTQLQVDVRSPKDLSYALGANKIDFIFHLAANASVPLSVEDPTYDYESNASGTFYVLEEMRKSLPNCRLVLASSAAVYGEPKVLPITEETPLLPISPYGASKLCAEVMVRCYAGTYKSQAMVARLFNAYGPGIPRFAVLDFLKKLEKDSTKLEILGTGKQLRDFTFVSDTVEGLMQVAAKGVPGEAYNIASGTSHSVTDVAKEILRQRGLDKTTQITYSSQSWNGDAQFWSVNIAKAKSLGYESKVALPEGLKEVIRWFDQTRSK